VLQGAGRLQSELRGWLKDVVKPDEMFLDLGCGAGSLLVAAVANGCRGIGVDVSMTWLVVARQLIIEAGGEPILAAGLGESLPLPDNMIDAVVSLDVIEHVGDPARYLSEISRVTKPRGHVALSTPNRFSLTPEPHVFVWGVGWLPQPWQVPYVRWRSGLDYSGTKLMGSAGLSRLLRANTEFKADIIVPPISQEEIGRFRAFKARVARAYNRINAKPYLRWFFLLVGPFFRVVGTKTDLRQLHPDGRAN
jgi:SAM-dependent methyltransferase